MLGGKRLCPNQSQLFFYQLEFFKNLQKDHSMNWTGDEVEHGDIKILDY